MANYKIAVTETFLAFVDIEAENEEQALKNVENIYNSGDHAIHFPPQYPEVKFVTVAERK